MKYPLAMIPYSNMAPYRLMGVPKGCEWIELFPSHISSALRDRRALGAAVPVGDLPALDDIVEPVGALGIAASGAVRSVLLFSNTPLELIKAPLRLKLTNQSSSSVKLLYILLRERLAEDELPIAAAEGEEYDGELLIGDEALLRYNSYEFKHVADLAEVWYDKFQKPFVFARWVVRKDAPQELKKELLEWLEQMRLREAELIEQASRMESARLSFSVEEMADYFRGMTRVFGKAELDGQRFFLEKLLDVS